MLQHQIAQHAAYQREWLERHAQEDPAWVGASTNNETTVALTPQELGDLTRALGDVMLEHTERARARREAEGDDDGSRTVKIFFQAFPLPPD